MKLNDAIEYFLLRCERKTTQRSYRQALERMARFLGPGRDVTDITEADMLRWRQSLKKVQNLYESHDQRPTELRELSPHTIHKRLKTARAFWNVVVKKGWLEQSPMADIKIKAPPKPEVTRRKASLSTLTALAPVMREDAHDWAMFLFFLDSGARAIAVSRIRLGHVDFQECTAFLLEKNDVEHTVSLTSLTIQAIQDWLEIRPEGTPYNEVFLNTQKKPWTPSSISSWLRRRCWKAKVRPIGTHALRRAVGCHMALAGVPVSLVQLQLGHSSPDITARYYMPDGLDELRALIEKFGLVKMLGLEDEDDDVDVVEDGENDDDDVEILEIGD